MKTRIIYFLALMSVVLLFSCEEKDRKLAIITDSVAPGNPTEITWKPLYGGARFFYNIPADEDLLSINATYKNGKGQDISFSVSYFKDSLDIYGFKDTIDYNVELYALDRTGNKSKGVTVTVKPNESAVSRVMKTIVVKPGFSSFFLDWIDELEENINVYVDYAFVKDGEERKYTSVFSSNKDTVRKFVENLTLTPEDSISVGVRVEDTYGNITQTKSFGKISLYEDNQLPKDEWVLPLANDSIGGVPECFGDGLEGRSRYVIDGYIDSGDNLNFMHTSGRGRTGIKDDGNVPWNFMIDLGGYYNLSRIVTVQRHSGNSESQGQYYKSENVGIYNMYYWDEDSAAWVFISQHKIAIPKDLSGIEIVEQAEAGDEAYLYPDDPKYTPRTRWFRYEALWCFDSNYTSTGCNCLSEITLFGKHADE